MPNCFEIEYPQSFKFPNRNDTNGNEINPIASTVIRNGKKVHHTTFDVNAFYQLMPSFKLSFTAFR